MKTLAKELKWSARRLARSPGSTLAALSVLALGIGSSVTMFTVARAVLLKALPLHEPRELVLVERLIGSEITLYHSPADLLDLRERCDAFSGVSGSARFQALLTGTLEPSYVTGASVTPDYFDTLGATPILGEVFHGDASGPSAELDVVVLSWQLWQTRLGADRGIIGRSILLDDHSYRVVGVLPEELTFLNADLWVQGPQGLPRPPIPMGPELTVRRDFAYLTILGRLGPGWNLETAGAAVESAGRGIVEEYPAGYPEVSFSIEPLRHWVSSEAENHLTTLSAGVALVFLLVCFNVAGLLMSRSIGRSDEDAIKLALGASRSQALAAGFTESLLLATVGGVLGTLASIIGVRLFLFLAPPMPRSQEASLDAAVLLFAAGVALTAALLGGVLPSLRTVRPQGHPILEGNRQHGQSRRRKLTWSMLVAFEIAGMVVLLVSALALGRRLLELRTLDLGFQPEGLLVASLQLPPHRYPQPASVVAFFDEVLARLDALPETESVGAAVLVPLQEGEVGLSFSIPGTTIDPEAPRPAAAFSAVSEGYFKTMGIRVLSGRSFGPGDRQGSTPVAAVNQSLAERYWQNQNPLGAELRIGDEEELVRIVGIVADVRYSLSEAEVSPRIYRPYRQMPWPAMSVALRSRGEASRLKPAVRRAVREIDPGQPLSAIDLMEDYLSSALRPARYLFLLVGGFALLAVAISSVGLYGLLAFKAREEERELTVRLALGAPRSVLVRAQLRYGLLIAATGISLGMAGVFGAMNLLERVLPDEDRAGPGLFLAVALLVVVIAGVSSFVPARQVLKLDPSRAVRDLTGPR